MSRLKGVTEDYWSTLHEDKKFRWRIFSRGFAFFATFAVSKIGLWYLDLALSLFVTFVTMFVIESQRAYSKYSPAFRKAITRLMMFFGAWSVTVLGVFFFAFIAISAGGATLSGMDLPRFVNGASDTQAIFLLVIFAILMIFAVIKNFRDLKMEELIHTVPKQQLKRLLVRKEFKAEIFPFFAYFEIVVIVVACMYLIAATTILHVLVSIVSPSL